jgi:hypothetical protein
MGCALFRELIISFYDDFKYEKVLQNTQEENPSVILNINKEEKEDYEDDWEDYEDEDEYEDVKKGN